MKTKMSIQPKISLAIIDSGVSLQHPDFKDDAVEGLSITQEEISQDFQDQNGHGTAIYGILRDTREYCSIVNIKILDADEAKESTLIAALRYCLAHHVQLVNISAGLTICFSNELEKICQELEAAGTIIVSAFANDGSVSYPAAYSSVIGVDSGDFCFTKNELEYVENSIVNIRAYGRIQRLRWLSPPMLMLGGSSFACAHVTCMAAELMATGYSGKEAILAQLKLKAKYMWKPLLPDPKDKLTHTIKKAALFPFNKEMHGLIRFGDLLSFEITDVYDVKYSGHVGAATDHLLGDQTVTSLKIQNISKIDWERIDTLILGHMEQLSAAINYNDLLTDLLVQAQKHDVFVYAFDDLTSVLQSLNKPPEVYFPSVTSKDLPSFQFGKLYRISKPVLGIFGTSSKQGKFTVQLELRRRFLKAGYEVGQIGTEPTALLYGMDCVFPSGYHTTVKLDRYDVVRYLNHEVNRLCEKNEIILVGSQSGTVSYDTGNLKQTALSNYEFLIGTQPDAVILCVNPYDSEGFLKRTINLIESAASAEVIALVLFPMKLKSDWSGIYGGKTKMAAEEIDETKKRLFKAFNRPVFCLGAPEEMDQLAEISAEFFAADPNTTEEENIL